MPSRRFPCLPGSWGLAFFLILKGFRATALDRRETPLATEAAAVAT